MLLMLRSFSHGIFSAKFYSLNDKRFEIFTLTESYAKIF